MKDTDIRQIYLKASILSQYPKDQSFSAHKQADKKLFISGGIGDFLAVQRFGIGADFDGTILLATRSWHEIQEIIYFTNPKIETIPIIKDFPKDIYSFLSIEHFISCSNVRKLKIPSNLQNVEDYSISKIFPLMQQKSTSLASTRLIEEDCADLTAYKLPEKYLAVVCQSNRDSSHAARGRNLTSEEIDLIGSSSDLPKVCIFCNCTDPNPKFIHLKNTTVLQSIQIVKNSIAYAGVDSWLSVVAGWFLKSENVTIKCINDHGLQNACCYWPFLDPEKTLVSKIEKVNWGA